MNSSTVDFECTSVSDSAHVSVAFVFASSRRQRRAQKLANKYDMMKHLYY